MRRAHVIPIKAARHLVAARLKPGLHAELSLERNEGSRAESPPVAQARDERTSDLLIAFAATDDDEIVRRIKGGEARLFEVLMKRHNRLVFRAARAIVQSEDEAEDVMQDAYVRAYEHLGDYAGRARFSTWLVRIALNEALARRRRAGRFSSLDEEQESALMSTHATPERRASDRELRNFLERAIDELPADFRAVFVLRAVEQMSVLGVAESLGIPEDTVKTRFFRARLRLRRSLTRKLEAETTQIFDLHLSRCERVVRRVLARLAIG